MTKAAINRILLFPDTTTNGGGTVVPATTDINSVPKGSTTQEPPPAKDPPKEELDKTFSIESFEVQQLEPTTDANKQPEEKKKEVKQEEVPTAKKQGEEVEKKEEKKGLTSFLKPPAKKEGEVKDDKKAAIPANKTVTVPTKVTRDYTGHTADEVAAFKKMSDEGYTFVKQILAEKKELEKLKDSNYLQHEQAYTLDPQYQTTRQEISFAQREAQCWKNQLINMAAGKTWREFKGFDDKGQPIYGPEMQPTTEAAEDVRQVLAQINNITAQKVQELEQFPAKYKTRIAEDARAIEQEIKSRFEWEQKSELLEHTLPIQFEDGVKDVSIKQIREDFISLFPPYMRNQLGTKVAANLMVSLRIGEMMLADAVASKTVEQTIEQEAERVEPTSIQKPVGGGKVKGKTVNGVTEFTLADYPV